MTDDAGPAFFRIHLEALTGFARELEAQLDALAGPTDHLARLTAAPLPAGRFAEACELAGGHHAVAARLTDLLATARAAVGSAAQVTRTVAAGYAAADRCVADSYRRLADDGGRR